MKPDKIRRAVAAQTFTSFEIRTDGSGKGTEILLNGKPIKGLRRVNFEHWASNFSPFITISVADEQVEPGTLFEVRELTLIPPDRSKD